jgi:hypothetical protein
MPSTTVPWRGHGAHASWALTGATYDIDGGQQLLSGA